MADFLSREQVLTGVSPFNEDEKRYLRELVASFGSQEVSELKRIEAETRHDVKAVEYFLQDRLRRAGEQIANTDLPRYLAAVHIFALPKILTTCPTGFALRAQLPMFGFLNCLAW